MLSFTLLPTGASVPDDLIVDFVVGPAADGGSSEEAVSLFPKLCKCLEDISALHALDADPKKVRDREGERTWRGREGERETGFGAARAGC